MRTILSCLASSRLACATAGLILASGCTNNAQVGDDGQGGQGAASGSATGASTGASTTSSGAGGAGGAMSTSSTSASSTTATTGAGTASTGTGGGGCTGASIDVTGDGELKKFPFMCQGAYGNTETDQAEGHIGYAKPISVDPTQKEQVWVEGCAYPDTTPPLASISLWAPQAVVGTSMTGTISYNNGLDSYANAYDTDVTLTVTSIDAVAINGSFTAAVNPVNNGAALNLSGTFSVCRVADFLPP